MDSLETLKAGAQELTLGRGKAEFGGAMLCRGDRSITLGWFAETEVRNVVWAFVVEFRLGWPPVQHLRCFTFVS